MYVFGKTLSFHPKPTSGSGTVLVFVISLLTQEKAAARQQRQSSFRIRMLRSHPDKERYPLGCSQK